MTDEHEHGRDPDYQRRPDKGIRDWMTDAEETVAWAKKVRADADEMLGFGIKMKRWLENRWWFKMFVKLDKDI